MRVTRGETRVVLVGDVKIGGGNPVVVQSMTNTNTCDIQSTVEQIIRLQDAGCELVRVTVPNREAAAAIIDIKKQIGIPLVADIHFDYRLALESIQNGVDKLRINPGNIGDVEKIKQVVAKAKEYSVPIRIGVNSGSLEKDLLQKYGRVTPEALVESALRHVDILEALDFDDIIVALKGSSVVHTIRAYQLISEKIKYPLHVGITESGTVYSGSIKSAVGIGTILSNGIGDTIRVSLTGDPVQEIHCAKEILKSLELRKFGVTFVSCPTCGRTEVDLIPIANEIETFCLSIDKDIKVAVMGCVVNGPGESREADIGVACGKGVGVIFKHGEMVRKVDENKIIEELKKEIENY